MATFGSSVRRGLPRVADGEPWPPAGEVPVEAAPVVAAALVAEPETLVAEATVVAEPVEASATVAPSTSSETSAASVGTVAVAAAGGQALRRGLPRVVGGEPWPPAGFAPAAGETAETTVTDATVPPAAEAPAPAARAVRRGLPRTAAEAGAVASTAGEASVAVETAERTPEPAATPSGIPLSQPLPFTRTVWQGTAGREFEDERRAGKVVAAPEPKRIGPFTPLQWAGAVIVGGGGLLFAAGMAVFAVRWLLSTQWGVDFLAAYPGEYHLPEGAPVGFPTWLGWQHFFNVFLMVLIIRSGLQVRTEKRPSVFWSPRSNGKRKISLNLWFHQSLDILWLVNGAIFVVLLFVTGQWMRIVPTSWEVFPNAISAALQYVSLDWPTENGWVNYNSLQQLAYFATVFVAAPLAAITGVRMSGVWPKNATGLNKAYPVEWARAVHFPVMLYFCLFIFVHVALVFATGALRNLNHMYAAQGSTDPNAYADNWAGFWIFSVSILVLVAAWVAARPLILAPIARLFGKVGRG